jgi:ABC-2 type transport system permease protein
MTRVARIQAEFRAEWYSFMRRRTAVMFTFLFPVILIVIFGALVRAGSTGLFAEPPAYYVPGYFAVVVLFTPLSRISSTVARHRSEKRFQKLATTPLSRGEWLLAHTLVTTVLVLIACFLVLLIGIGLTNASIVLSPLVIVFIILGVAVFSGIGATIGRLVESQDGAIAVSNTIALPLVFLSETFVPPSMLPTWFEPLILVSPLTYFARGTRASLTGSTSSTDLVILLVLAIVALAIGMRLVPWRD